MSTMTLARVAAHSVTQSAATKRITFIGLLCFVVYFPSSKALPAVRSAPSDPGRTVLQEADSSFWLSCIYSVFYRRFSGLQTVISQVIHRLFTKKTRSLDVVPASIALIWFIYPSPERREVHSQSTRRPGDSERSRHLPRNPSPL